MTIRITHLFPDSPFLSFTADIFEQAAPGANEFLVHSVRGDLSRHRMPAATRVREIVPDAEGSETARAILAESDIAVFHSVGGFAAQILASLPPTTLRVWSGWGGDYYGSNAWPTSGQLGPLTSRWERHRMTLPGRILRMRRNLIGARPFGPAARAADVFSAPIPDDLAVFKRRFRGFRGQYVQLKYSSVEDSYAAASDVTGDDILLGNSAGLTGNLLESLELLAATGTGGRRIVTPLSYGDPAYADAVTQRGTELFGSDFMPLREFIPFADYQRIVADCSTVVMGHYRRQGVGNVAMALWSGARVFLDPRSPLTTFLRRLGAEIGTLDDVARDGLPHGPSSTQERDANRTVLQQFWGRDTVIANTRSLIELAER